MNIKSLALKWAAKSFTMSKTINFHKKLSLMVYDAPEGGLKDPYEPVDKDHLKEIVDPTGFL